MEEFLRLKTNQMWLEQPVNMCQQCFDLAYSMLDIQIKRHSRLSKVQLSFQREMVSIAKQLNKPEETIINVKERKLNRYHRQEMEKLHQLMVT